MHLSKIANLSGSMSILWTSLTLTSMTCQGNSHHLVRSERYGKSFLQLVIVVLVSGFCWRVSQTLGAHLIILLQLPSVSRDFCYAWRQFVWIALMFCEKVAVDRNLDVIIVDRHYHTCCWRSSWPYSFLLC